MSNLEIIKIFNIAFDSNDNETVLKYLTDDFEWHLLGNSTIVGKANMKKFFDDHGDIKIITCTKEHFLADGDVLSVNGEVLCTDKTGNVYDMYYCDIYEMENSLIKKMTSYTVNKNKAVNA